MKEIIEEIEKIKDNYNILASMKSKEEKKILCIHEAELQYLKNKKGLSTKEIAQLLKISKYTVENYFYKGVGVKREIVCLLEHMFLERMNNNFNEMRKGN
jgi:predicted DNA-binding protein (UPF0251 family)